MTISFVVENDDILAHSITQQTTRLFALFVNLWTREFFAGQSHMVPRPELAAEWAYENWVFATMPNVKEFIRSVAVRGQKMTLIDEIRNEIDDRLGDNLETFSCDELETLYANMKGEHPSEMKCFMWLGTQIVRSVDAAERRGRKKLDLDYACQGASMSMDDFNTGEIIVVDDGDILVMHTDVTDAALWTVSSNIEKDQRSVE